MFAQTIFQNDYVRAFLKGAAYPGMIVTGFALTGLLIDAFNFRLFNGPLSAFKTSLTIGTFCLLFFSVQIIMPLFMIDDRPVRLRFIKALGYLTVWGICLFIALSAAAA